MTSVSLPGRGVGPSARRITPGRRRTSLPPREAPPAEPRSWPGILAALVLLALSIDIGVSAGQQGFGTPTLLRIAVLLGGLLAVVLLGRFEAFLLVVLVVRPILDITTATGGAPVLASAVAALIVLGVMVWLGAQVRAGTLRPISWMGRCCIALLVIMTISAGLSSDPVRSVLQVARLAAAVAVFLAVEQLLTSEARVRRVLLACYASALVPMLVAALQLSTGSFLRSANGLGRVTGTFVHPNSFGFYLVLLLVMGAAVLRHLRGGSRLFVALVLAGGTAALIMTYSRGSWVTLVVGILVVGVLQSRVLLLLLPAGLLAIPVVAPSVLARIADLSQSQSVIGTPGNSLLWRVDHWLLVLRGARGHELLGIGPGASDFLGERVLPPHNDFVRMYVETGTLGLLAYLAVLLAAVSIGLRAYRTQPPGLGRGLAVGALGCTAAFLVGSVGGNLISQVVVLLYLFTFLAAASATGRFARPAPGSPERAWGRPTGDLVGARR